MRKRKAKALVVRDHVRRAGKPKANLGQIPSAHPLANMRDVYLAIDGHPKSREIRLALDRWEELQGPLQNIPARGPTVRSLFKKVHPTRDGIPHREWGRIKKLIGEARRHCGVEKMPARFEVKLTDEWKSLLASVPKRPYQVAIERFARWLSMRKIAPADVQAGDFDRFGDDLTETTRKELARNVYLRLCNAWDDAVDAYPHWPRVRPEHTLRRLWFTRDWEQYPHTTLSEVDRMFEDRRNTDADSLSPWRAPMGDGTEGTQRAQIRTILHAICEATGCQPHELTSLRVALTPANVNAALKWRLQRSKKKRTWEIYCVAINMRNIARHWLKADQSTCAQFDKIIESLYPNSKKNNPRSIAVSQKLTTLFLALQDDNRLRSLLELGQAVLYRHRGKHRLTRREGLEVQFALGLELLIITAMKPSRLPLLEIERDILPSRGAGPAQFVVPKDAYNDAGAIELPPAAAGLLELHLSHLNSCVRLPSGRWLFPGQSGRSKNVLVLSRQIAELVADQIGYRITAGQFRFVIGVLHLQRNPGNYKAVRVLFGHRTIKWTERVFDLFARLAAGKRHDAKLSATRTDHASAP